METRGENREADLIIDKLSPGCLCFLGFFANNPPRSIKSVLSNSCMAKGVITVLRDGEKPEQTRPADGCGLEVGWRCHPVRVAHLDDNWEKQPPIGSFSERVG